MADIIDIFTLNEVVLLRFFVSLILAISLGVGIAFIYRITHKGLNYESSFISTLALLAPIVTLVMFFIQGDLVLSLGLVGSLSIIRFRTPIKDTRDMVFLFWTITVGLGMGTTNWTLSILASVILAIVMIVFYKIRYGKRTHSEYVLMIQGTKDFNKSILSDWKNKLSFDLRLRSREVEYDQFKYVYELRYSENKSEDIDLFISELQKLPSIDKVALLSPQLNLPM
jgi:hypothetical protein